MSTIRQRVNDWFVTKHNISPNIFGQSVWYNIFIFYCITFQVHAGRCKPLYGVCHPVCAGRCKPLDTVCHPVCAGRCKPLDVECHPVCAGRCKPLDVVCPPVCAGRCKPLYVVCHPVRAGRCKPLDADGELVLVKELRGGRVRRSTESTLTRHIHVQFTVAGDRVTLQLALNTDVDTNVHFRFASNTHEQVYVTHDKVYPLSN